MLQVDDALNLVARVKSGARPSLSPEQQETVTRYNAQLRQRSLIGEATKQTPASDANTPLLQRKHAPPPTQAHS